MITTFIKYFILLAILIVLQKTLITLIAISKYNIVPDVILLGVVFIAIKEGKIFGTLFGFVAGILFDILSGSFLGLSALTYSVTGFIAGFYLNPEKEDKYFKKNYFLVIVIICSLIANLIYFSIYFQGSPISFIEIIVLYIISTSLFTTLLGLVYLIIYNWKFNTKT